MESDRWVVCRAFVRQVSRACDVRCQVAMFAQPDPAETMGLSKLYLNTFLRSSLINFTNRFVHRASTACTCAHATTAITEKIVSMVSIPSIDNSDAISFKIDLNFQSDLDEPMQPLARFYLFS